MGKKKTKAQLKKEVRAVRRAADKNELAAYLVEIGRSPLMPPAPHHHDGSSSSKRGRGGSGGGSRGGGTRGGGRGGGTTYRHAQPLEYQYRTTTDEDDEDDFFFTPGHQQQQHPHQRYHSDPSHAPMASSARGHGPRSVSAHQHNAGSSSSAAYVSAHNHSPPPSAGGDREYHPPRLARKYDPAPKRPQQQAPYYPGSSSATAAESHPYAQHQAARGAPARGRGVTHGLSRGASFAGGASAAPRPYDQQQQQYGQQYQAPYTGSGFAPRGGSGRGGGGSARGRGGIGFNGPAAHSTSYSGRKTFAPLLANAERFAMEGDSTTPMVRLAKAGNGNWRTVPTAANELVFTAHSPDILRAYHIAFVPGGVLAGNDLDPKPVAPSSAWAAAAAAVPATAATSPTSPTTTKPAKPATVSDPTVEPTALERAEEAEMWTELMLMAATEVPGLGHSSELADDDEDYESDLSDLSSDDMDDSDLDDDIDLAPDTTFSDSHPLAIATDEGDETDYLHGASSETELMDHQPISSPPRPYHPPSFVRSVRPVMMYDLYGNRCDTDGNEYEDDDDEEEEEEEDDPIHELRSDYGTEDEEEVAVAGGFHLSRPIVPAATLNHHMDSDSSDSSDDLDAMVTSDQDIHLPASDSAIIDRIDAMEITKTPSPLVPHPTSDMDVAGSDDQGGDDLFYVDTTPTAMATIPERTPSPPPAAQVHKTVAIVDDLAEYDLDDYDNESSKAATRPSALAFVGQRGSSSRRGGGRPKRRRGDLGALAFPELDALPQIVDAAFDDLPPPIKDVEDDDHGYLTSSSLPTTASSNLSVRDSDLDSDLLSSGDEGDNLRIDHGRRINRRGRSKRRGRSDVSDEEDAVIADYMANLAAGGALSDTSSSDDDDLSSSSEESASDEEADNDDSQVPAGLSAFVSDPFVLQWANSGSHPDGTSDVAFADRFTDVPQPALSKAQARKRAKAIGATLANGSSAVNRPHAAATKPPKGSKRKMRGDPYGFADTVFRATGGYDPKSVGRKRRGKLADSVSVDLRAVSLVIEMFLESPLASTQLPPMPKNARRVVVALAGCYGLRSKLIGNKMESRLQLTRTKHTDMPDADQRAKIDALLCDAGGAAVIEDQWGGQTSKGAHKRQSLSEMRNTRPGGAGKSKHRRGGEVDELDLTGGNGMLAKKTHGHVVGEHAAPIAENNVGHRLLLRLGWAGPGAALGKDEHGGLVLPLTAMVRGKNRGLGA
ncbi:hypothetical protein BC828DRAFT_386754 [Blastocladiella britannica]|nr:hypothetical protein BC828DRAFT_386754 [Blastocladiella britannica]